MRINKNLFTKKKVMAYIEVVVEKKVKDQGHFEVKGKWYKVCKRVLL